MSVFLYRYVNVKFIIAVYNNIGTYIVFICKFMYMVKFICIIQSVYQLHLISKLNVHLKKRYTCLVFHHISLKKFLLIFNEIIYK